MSGSDCVQLPGSMKEWRAVLNAALSLPQHAVLVSTHLAIIDAATGTFPTSTSVFGAPVKVESRDPGSAVMLALMPSKRGNGDEFDATGQPTHAPPIAATRFRGLDVCFPVTVRQTTMRTHSGEVAFPGGRLDAGESAVDGAIRETAEEIAVKVTPRDVCGTLSRTYSFPSRSFVTPVVAVLDDFEAPSVASPDEVASVHMLSLGALVADARFHHRFHTTSRSSGASFRFPQFFTSSTNRVWGLTALVIVELVSRVSVVLRIRSAPPDRLLAAWGDLDSVSARPLIPFSNPYDELAKAPSKL
jgi:8-oxo-dGTP pyrophosphatase MutT (NUDIX family)